MVSTTSTLLSREYHTGSGVILDSDGYIVTNTHVVDDVRSIQVVLLAPLEERAKQKSILKSRGKVLGAQTINVDRETDLAVLKVQEKDLPFLELGDSEAVRQGQLVFAFGSPLGLENLVMIGVVSAVARQLRPEDPMVYIQTDAPINPGNTGGPLVETKGRVMPQTITPTLASGQGLSPLSRMRSLTSISALVERTNPLPLSLCRWMDRDLVSSTFIWNSAGVGGARPKVEEGKPFGDTFQVQFAGEELPVQMVDEGVSVLEHQVGRGTLHLPLQTRKRPTLHPASGAS